MSMPEGPGFKFRDELAATARKIMCGGKGILAADESTGTIGKRLAPIGVENTEENRRFYRQLLFSTPELNKHISGVIMFEETLFQKDEAGTDFVKGLVDQDIVVGIKVDKGVKPLAGSKGEVYCTGLDGLGERCAKYYAQGARFAKWRAVMSIVDGQLPSDQAVRENAYGLARYAATCQENGLVPIVEPEIMMDGEHDIDVAQAAAEKVWSACYKALADQHVFLEGTMLKPAMVIPGQDCKGPNNNANAIALATVTALRRAVPAAVPGICFLSGGQGQEEASVNLSAINAIPIPTPWTLTFSYGRGLQATVLSTWGGKPENVKAAQAELQKLAENNGLASLGKYEGSGEGSVRLFVANYTY